MKYKWSTYNLITDDGEYIILTNTMYFNIIKIKKDTRVYKSLISNSISELSKEQIDFLKNNNYIVEKDFDEKAYCDFVRNRSVYSDSILELTILPTDTCNFKCVYCYESINHQFMSEESEKSLIKFIKKNIHKYKRLNLAWFGGEPLVCKEQVIRITQQIYNICKSKGVLFSGRMTTNGYELDLETFNILTKNHILAYQICIDGSEESHNKQRPHATNDDSYNKIIKNIYDIKKYSTTNTFLISLRSNITKDTEMYLEKYLDEIYSIVGSDPRFEIVFQGVRNWGGSRIKENNVNIVKNESSLYEKWYRKAAEKGLVSAERMDLSIACSMCAGNFITGYVVYPDCSIHKCTLAYFSKEHQKEGHIGQIDSRGKLELDYNKIMKWINHDVSKFNKCNSCKLYPICKGGSCPYSSNIVGNSIETSQHCQELQAMVNSKILCLNIKKQIFVYEE